MFSVTQNGKPLDPSKYVWDEATKVFGTNESNLVLDFSEYVGTTFKTGSDCTFNTAWNCTFNTSHGCTFNTAWNCTFNTAWNCTFKTGDYCTFKTGSDCTFKTGLNCTFNTSHGCTFNTAWNCTFNTAWNCTFNVGEKCCLHYTWSNCFEVHKLVPNKIVKLLENGKLEDVAPVKPKQTVTLELTEEQLEQVKKTLGI